jgi:carbon-monoxide dehydrogenase medium subunit
MTRDLGTPSRYLRPTLLKDALAAIAQPGAVIMAGGQTLIPRLVSGTSLPTMLVNLCAISELRSIDCKPNMHSGPSYGRFRERLSDALAALLERLSCREKAAGSVIIGAMVTLTSLIESDALFQRCPLIRQAASKTATPTIRNRATLVGNLVVADPASQLPTVMIALGATLLLQRAGGQRWVSAEEFFLGPNQSDTGVDEIVTHVRIPDLPAHAGCSITDVAPRRNSRPLATATAIVGLDEEKRISFARLSVSGCGDVPRRCRTLEDALRGLDFTRAPDVAKSMLGSMLPIPGKGVLDADYAVMVLPALMRRSIVAACASARPKLTAP